MYLLDVN